MQSQEHMFGAPEQIPPEQQRDINRDEREQRHDVASQIPYERSEQAGYERGYEEGYTPYVAPDMQGQKLRPSRQQPPAQKRAERHLSHPRDGISQHNLQQNRAGGALAHSLETRGGTAALAIMRMQVFSSSC